MSYINVVDTLLPEYKYTPEECVEYFQKWIYEQDDRYKKKAQRIFDHTMILSRHAIVPIDLIFTKRSFQETNDLYKEKSIELGTQMLKRTVEKADLSIEDIDVLITTSCTGYMLPAVNFYIAKNLNMRNDIRHIPITEIGCAAGVAALLFADDYIKAYPDKKVAVLTIEFPSNTIQLDDFSWENVIGNVVFADGVGCAILSNEPIGPKIEDTGLYHMVDKTEILGYSITNTGLKMNLDKTIPTVIEQHFHQILKPLFNRNTITPKDLDHYMFHPGGIKILDKIESLIKKLGKHVNESREIMSTLGNMSSSTIFFILQKVLKRAKKGDRGLGVSFGPGFSTYQVLLLW